MPIGGCYNSAPNDRFISGGIKMSNIIKLRTAQDVFQALKHDVRDVSPENAELKSFDVNNIKEDWDLTPHHEPKFEYYKQRLAEVPHMKRKDLVTAASWYIPLPKEIPRGSTQEKRFFRAAESFLEQRYGRENCFSSVVHRDEKNVDGTPSVSHLHFKFIPVNKKGRVSWDGTITRSELRSFHPALQKWMNDNGIRCNVNSGITRLQGGNRTVEQIRAGHTQQRGYENGIRRTQMENTREVSRYH